jgi:hypothetical protein
MSCRAPTAGRKRIAEETWSAARIHVTNRLSRPSGLVVQDRRFHVRVDHGAILFGPGGSCLPEPLEHPWDGARESRRKVSVRTDGAYPAPISPVENDHHLTAHGDRRQGMPVEMTETRGSAPAPSHGVARPVPRRCGGSARTRGLFDPASLRSPTPESFGGRVDQPISAMIERAFARSRSA